MQNRSSVNEREFTRLVDRLVTPSFTPWVVNLFLFLLTNAQLDSDEEKNVVEWFGNVKQLNN